MQEGVALSGKPVQYGVRAGEWYVTCTDSKGPMSSTGYCRRNDILDMRGPLPGLVSRVCMFAEGCALLHRAGSSGCIVSRYNDDRRPYHYEVSIVLPEDQCSDQPEG